MKKGDLHHPLGGEKIRDLMSEAFGKVDEILNPI
jgi:hypothetical protein